MYKTHCDEINPGDNVIVGLGDSFTQGVGAYSLDTWASIPGNSSIYNISGQHFVSEQGQNNWVRQLRDKFLPNYKVYNLGMNGGGNRATIRELYLYPLPPNLGNVVVVLMATAIERFDMLKKSDDTAGVNWHQKWQTIWPVYNTEGRGVLAKLEKEYMEQLWSPRNDVMEFLFNVRDIQNLCKANGYKFLFGSAFDQQINRQSLKNDLGDKAQFIDIPDWNDYIQIPNRRSFMDMINQLEDNKHRTIHEIYERNSALKMPTKYITPCAHWSIEGNYKVAEYLYGEMQRRELV